MLHQRHLRKQNILFLTELSLRAVKLVLLFSFIIIYIIIPIINYGNYKSLGNTPELYRTVIHTARRLIPFSSILPAVMILRIFSETDCNEILNMYLKGRRLIIVYLTNAIIAFSSVALFVFYSYYLNIVFAEYLKILSASFMFFSVSYFLMLLTHSTAVTTLILMVYEIFLITSAETSLINFVLFNETKYDCPFSWGYMILIGMFIITAGEAVDKIRFRR